MVDTFNNAGYRTDAMAADLAVEGNRQRNEGIRYIGAAAAGAAEQFQRSQMMQAEMQIREAQAVTQIAGWQQEQELNAYKMQQVLAIDQAMISRHQVRLAEVQADTAKAQYDEQFAKKTQASAEARMTLYESALTAGLDLDFETGKTKEFESDEKREEAFERLRRLKFSGGEYSPDLHQTRLLANADRAMKMGMRAEAERLKSEYRRLYGGEPPPSSSSATTGGQLDARPTSQSAPSAPTATPISQAAPAEQPSAAHQALMNAVNGDQWKAHVAANTFNDPEWGQSPFWTRLGETPRDRLLMSAGIATYAQALGGNEGRNVDPKMLHMQIMKSLETYPVGMATLLRFTGDTPRDIQAKLRVLYGLGSREADNVMQMADRLHESYTK